MASWDGEKELMPDRKTAAADPVETISPIRQERSRDGDLQRVDAAVEARIVRKLDRLLLPFVSFLFLLAYLDRSNIGNARIAGMQNDLKLSRDGNDYNWLLTIFYVGYIVFEWFVLMWKVVPPHIWAAICITGVGLIATLQAAAANWSGMMALRFFLGMFEAGYAPGVPFLLSFFYLRHELGLRIGFQLGAAPLAACFSGALAYGITAGSPPIANWRLLFLVEGLPSILIGVVAWFVLPDSVDQAWFLSEEEKTIARARGVRQVGREGKHRIGNVSWSDIGVGVLDVKNYFTAMMYFSCNVSYSSLPVFLPTILNEMGFSTLNAQGLSAPPYFISFLVVITSTYIADKTQQRGITVMILSLVGALGYILLAATSATGPRYFGVYLAAAGIFPCIANILPWVLNNQGSDTKRGVGIAMLNLVGQCGPLLGTRIYPATDNPYYRMGMWVCASFMLFNGLLAFGLRLLLVWENKKLDQKYGRMVDGAVIEQQTTDGLQKELRVEAQIQDIKPGCENDGPGFRYVL